MYQISQFSKCPVCLFYIPLYNFRPGNYFSKLFKKVYEGIAFGLFLLALLTFVFTFAIYPYITKAP